MTPEIEDTEEVLSERVAIAEEWMIRIIDYCAARNLGYDIDSIIAESYKWADKILKARE